MVTVRNKDNDVLKQTLHFVDPSTGGLINCNDHNIQYI